MKRFAMSCWSAIVTHRHHIAQLPWLHSGPEVIISGVTDKSADRLASIGMQPPISGST